MSNKQLLLPLYIVHKQAFRLNEKNIIIFLLVVSALSIFVIIRSLPSNLSATSSEIKKQIKPENEGLKNISEIGFRKPIETNKHIPIEPIPNQNGKKHIFNLKRRNKVKEMTLFAWKSYKTYAWGSSELRPVSKVGHSPGIFGSNSNGIGATIVDSLDTLFIMGLHNEYQDGKEWVSKNLNLNINSELSVFEVNIRFVGGLLSMHSLTNDKMFLDKADEIAQILLPAFDSPTGLPFSLFNPQTKNKQNYGWAASSCSILAELGTLSLEFQYLTDMTGKKVYQEKIDRIFQTLNNAEKPEGLYYNYINPNSGQWCNKQATLGALADSFYEYLLKLWIYKDRSDTKLITMYLNTMKAVQKKLIRKSSGGLTFVGETNDASALVHKMGHLACFSGGLFALTSSYVTELSEKEKSEYMRLAKEITNTCHESYVRTQTHLGPETFHFSGVEALSLNENEKYYILRPEVVESYFYMWRLTHDQKYRDWAWDVVIALERHCKTDNGYQGLKNVYQSNTSKDDVQQKTLKYLYLIFSDDNLIPLDRYVFNTEAHPFLIKKSF